MLKCLGTNLHTDAALVELENYVQHKDISQASLEEVYLYMNTDKYLD